MSFTPSKEIMKRLEPLDQETKVSILKAIEKEIETNSKEAFIRMLQREQKRRSGVNVHIQLSIE